ncbi:hypothetical protein K490DRAFT_68820 [Saccharata proteae CBS 121410]|uniref:NAD(P)-binding protein n=1 Tax=Saccharata proteae CBS 121410 TaxID=1314787 RepID=A0A9P4HQ32_9PEZI|nr:hypothetical protein K490DRAFT_68820 [Saccharata proteae CBS 121410]
MSHLFKQFINSVFVDGPKRLTVRIIGFCNRLSALVSTSFQRVFRTPSQPKPPSSPPFWPVLPTPISSNGPRKARFREEFDAPPMPIEKVQNTEEVKASKVLTVTYVDVMCQEVKLPVTKSTGPVDPPSQDERKPAVSLKSKFLNGKSTMKKSIFPTKVATVTGGGRGLGLNMAQALAEVGVRGIATMDIQRDLGEEVAGELTEQTGVDTRFDRVDVRDQGAITPFVTDIQEHWNRILVAEHLRRDRCRAPHGDMSPAPVSPRTLTPSTTLTAAFRSFGA